MIEFLGILGAVVMPLWNIPLIIRIQQRRSSRDLSLPWALGIWGCLLLMLPSGLVSTDPVYRAFTIANIILFSVVLIQVLRFRGGGPA
jgi:hypothetical protein